MPNFRMKPITIEAFQWDGSIPQADHIETWSSGLIRWQGQYLWIQLADGETRIEPGDWVYRSPSGTFHTCDRRHFEMVFEPA